MKSLVLAEKPSVGRDIARVLNCMNKRNGYFEGDRYIVTWALGHLITLADPEIYGEQYQTWKIEDLPLLPSPLKLVVIKQTSKQFSMVKTLMNRKDIKEIIIATDAGREGELVARWIIEKLRITKPIKRLWISSVTDKAIKQGFSKLKDGKEYLNLYASAVARAEADWYVGINGTRALTTKHNAQLSCGRVQTPTLAMIARRDEEIKNFTPQIFYRIIAKTNDLTLTWNPKNKDNRIFDRNKADKLLESLKNKDGTVTDISSQKKKIFSPLLYNLTDLQSDANRIFGYSAKETLSLLQKLYEHHKLVTYPRTDSNFLSDDMIETFKDRLEACLPSDYGKIAASIIRKPIMITKSFIDNQKVSDHHAIIPTEERANLNKLNERERKIYHLIVKRFLSAFLPPFEYEQRTITAKIGTEVFQATGKSRIALGWKEIHQINELDEELSDESEQTIPDLKKDDRLKIITISKIESSTKPPKLFNEGTLLTAMENPTRYMSNESKELIETIGKTGGLGTVATRADIIEKLLNSFLIERKEKDILITNKGKQLLNLVPDDLKSPALTEEWEQKLELISKGLLQKNVFIDEIKSYTKSIVNEIKNSDSKFKHDNISGTKCPDCGKLMLEVQGKKGRMLVCQDRDCGHRKNIAKYTNARCPNCHKKLELRGEGEGQLFVCKCGHREKLSSFNERKKKNQNNRVSKKEITKYMKKQEKEEPINTALADALAKLKFEK